MKAAMIEKPGVLTVKDVPMPEVGEYDALCEILYGATCSGTDQHLISGRLEVATPAVLGHESVGRVIEVGRKVRHFKKGDIITRVGTPAAPTGEFYIAWGGFCEYGIGRDHKAMREDGEPKEKWNSYRVNQIVPSGIDPADATMIITWRETLSYSLRMGLEKGGGVFIIGSGGNGLAFANHATNLGCGPMVMVGSANRERQAAAVGVGGYYNYKAEKVMDVIKDEYPDGFDFVIDAVGKKTWADVALRVLNAQGTIGIYGIDDLGECMLNPINARGSFTYYNGHYDEEETHDRVVALMQKGQLNAGHWLDKEHTYELDDIQDAFEAVAQRKVVKALIKMRA